MKPIPHTMISAVLGLKIGAPVGIKSTVGSQDIQCIPKKSMPLYDPVDFCTMDQEGEGSCHIKFIGYWDNRNF